MAKSVWILGAGASASFGAPLMNPFIDDADDLRKSGTPREVVMPVRATRDAGHAEIPDERGKGIFLILRCARSFERHRRRLFWTTLLSGATAVSGCHPNSGCSTLDPYDHTIEVTAKDSLTGALAANATVKAIRAQRDSAAQVIGSDVTKYPAVLLVSGGGTYTVSVIAQSFAPWSTSVSVAGDCTQLHVPITALLLKAP